MRETRGTTTKRMQRRGGTTKTALPYPQPLLCAAAAAASRIARHDQRPSYPGREHRAQRAREELAADCSVCCCIRRHSLFFLPLSLSLSLSLSISLSLSLGFSSVVLRPTRADKCLSLSLSQERKRERKRERKQRKRTRKALCPFREQRAEGRRRKTLCVGILLSSTQTTLLDGARETRSLFLSLFLSLPLSRVLVSPCARLLLAACSSREGSALLSTYFPGARHARGRGRQE